MDIFSIICLCIVYFPYAISKSSAVFKHELYTVTVTYATVIVPSTSIYAYVCNQIKLIVTLKV